MVISHVDLRVRERDRAIAFYDAIAGALGLTRFDGETFTCYEPVRPDGGSEAETQGWLGFTVDPAMTPNLTRIAFAVDTCEDVDRVARVCVDIDAPNLEGPDYAYGPEYYAIFFDDPDGNRLEVCCVGPRAKAAS